MPRETHASLRAEKEETERKLATAQRAILAYEQSAKNFHHLKMVEVQRVLHPISLHVDSLEGLDCRWWWRFLPKELRQAVCRVVGAVHTEMTYAAIAQAETQPKEF